LQNKPYWHDCVPPKGRPTALVYPRSIPLSICGRFPTFAKDPTMLIEKNENSSNHSPKDPTTLIEKIKIYQIFNILNVSFMLYLQYVAYFAPPNWIPSSSIHHSFINNDIIPPNIIMNRGTIKTRVNGSDSWLFSRDLSSLALNCIWKTNNLSSHHLVKSSVL